MSPAPIRYRARIVLIVYNKLNYALLLLELNNLAQFCLEKQLAL